MGRDSIVLTRTVTRAIAEIIFSRIIFNQSILVLNIIAHFLIARKYLQTNKITKHINGSIQERSPMSAIFVG
jgi:hypothetical protein